MTTTKSVRRLLGAPARDKAAEREVEDELRFHIEMRTRDNIEAGMPAEDAMADAMRRFGDFDRIRAACEEIRRGRLEGVMKAFKGLSWVIFGCGLTLKLATSLAGLQSVGTFLILIAGLWRLLIHLREIRPDQRRITAAGQPTLSVTHPIAALSMSRSAENIPKPVPAYDKDGRTPVERLISDEE
jgi:hypothetical protein